MLSPKRVKYRKPQKGKNRGLANSGNYVAFGTYGLKSLEHGWITSRQIEASRIVISRAVRKIGRMWIRVFPHKSLTRKPAETRMGKGKGSPELWVAVVKPGTILFEVEGVDEKVAQEAFRKCSNKNGTKETFLKHMNKKDLDKMTKNKLIKQLADNEESLVNLRFQQKMQQLENPQSVRFMKREIAQIKTVLKEMELNIREEK